MGRFITPKGLKQLDSYRYRPGKYTSIDNALQPYWNYCASLLPVWMAPNLVTFTGWLILLSSAIIQLCYDFTFRENIPSWCFFYTALALWTYSTLDAIDGKQARRTGSSSALGQLFDHGCDAFCVSFLIINFGQMAQLQNMQILIIFIGAYTAFWIANWKEYNTGILMTNAGEFGVTESQILVVIFNILTGIYGQQIWAFTLNDVISSVVTSGITNKAALFLLNLPMGANVAYFFGGLMFLMAICELLQTLYQSRSIKSLKECFSLIVLMLCCGIWINFSFYRAHVGIVLFSHGLLTALLVCKIIVASVTKMELEIFHKELLPLIGTTVVMTILQVLGMPREQTFIFWVFFISVVVIAYRLLSATIEQLANHLHIYCFTLKRRNQRPEQSDEQAKTS